MNKRVAAQVAILAAWAQAASNQGDGVASSLKDSDFHHPLFASAVYDAAPLSRRR